MKRGHGHLLRYLLNRLRWHYYPRFHYVSRFPDHVDVEIASLCNMQCPMCYTTTQEYKSRVKRTFMSFDLFARIVDECARYKTFSIRLSLRGEAFLNKDILRMIRYAKGKGIKEVSTLTNGLALNADLFQEIMEAGLDWLTISFDGLGETYESIRRPARFQEALAKIRAYKEIKERQKRVKPVIKIQTVWPAIAEDPQAYFDLFRPLVDGIASNPLIDYLRNDTDIEYEPGFTCPVLWQRLVVGADGQVLLCSNDEFGLCILGDVRSKSLHGIWHGKRMCEARQSHLRKVGCRELEPCRTCYLPRKTQAHQSALHGHALTIHDYTNRPQEVGR